MLVSLLRKMVFWGKKENLNQHVKQGRLASFIFFNENLLHCIPTYLYPTWVPKQSHNHSQIMSLLSLYWKELFAITKLPPILEDPGEVSRDGTKKSRSKSGRVSWFCPWFLRPVPTNWPWVSGDVHHHTKSWWELNHVPFLWVFPF